MATMTTMTLNDSYDHLWGGDGAHQDAALYADRFDSSPPVAFQFPDTLEQSVFMNSPTSAPKEDVASTGYSPVYTMAEVALPTSLGTLSDSPHDMSSASPDSDLWQAGLFVPPPSFISPQPRPGRKLLDNDKTEDEYPRRKRRSQLRTAARTAKQRGEPIVTGEAKARAAHNAVEQQYRKRLNGHFERLLAVLPATISEEEARAKKGENGSEADERRVSKAEVLDRARRWITELERQKSALERERIELRARMGSLGGFMVMGNGGLGN